MARGSDLSTPKARKAEDRRGVFEDRRGGDSSEWGSANTSGWGRDTGHGHRHPAGATAPQVPPKFHPRGSWRLPLGRRVLRPPPCPLVKRSPPLYPSYGPRKQSVRSPKGREGLGADGGDPCYHIHIYTTGTHTIMRPHHEAPFPTSSHLPNGVVDGSIWQVSPRLSHWPRGCQ